MKGEQINYADLRGILKVQVKRALNDGCTSPKSIPFIQEFASRHKEEIHFIHDDLVCDIELDKLFDEENQEGIVDRIISIISNHDGTVIDPPYEDIDDWWGDINSTVNYFIWCYQSDLKAEARLAKVEKASIRQAGPHKCVAIISQIGPAKKTVGFYTNDKKPIRFDAEHQQSLRWHQHYVELKDDSWSKKLPGWSFGVAVVTKVGDTGEQIVQEAINEVVKKYGDFDCYTCEKWKIELGKYVPEKNKKMIAEIRDILEKHNLKMAGVL